MFEKITRVKMVGCFWAYILAKTTHSTPKVVFTRAIGACVMLLDMFPSGTQQITNHGIDCAFDVSKVKGFRRQEMEQT